MLETDSRQVRRARERGEAASPRLLKTKPYGNRAERRSRRPNDNEIIIRPTTLNASACLKRSRRDYRIRHKLRPPRGMVHPKTISMRRLVAMRSMALIFALAAKRVEERRSANA